MREVRNWYSKAQKNRASILQTQLVGICDLWKTI